MTDPFRLRGAAAVSPRRAADESTPITILVRPGSRGHALLERLVRSHPDLAFATDGDRVVDPAGKEMAPRRWLRAVDPNSEDDGPAPRQVAARSSRRDEGILLDGPATDRLLIRDGGAMRLLRESDIEWVEADGNYVNIHTGKKTYRLRATLSAIAERLDGSRFVRIHRSTIVNVDHIHEIVPWFSGDLAVVMESGARLKLSRGYRKAFETRFGFLG